MKRLLAYCDRNYPWLVIVLAALIAFLALHGCGTPPPPRLDPPPAAAAATDLHARADAAGLAAAEATAKGDKLAADYQSKLRTELLRLAGEADTRAQTEQTQIDERIAKEQAAADARADRRTAVWITVVGAVIAVGLFIVCMRIGLPLWIPGSVASIAAVGAGVYANAQAIDRVLGWTIAAAIVIALIAAAWWTIRRLHAGIGEATAHGDRIEKSIGTAMLGFDEQTRKTFQPVLDEAVTIAKNISGNKQISAGVHRLIQRVRGRSS